jgi:hypothetical protein
MIDIDHNRRTIIQVQFDKLHHDSHPLRKTARASRVRAHARVQLKPAPPTRQGDRSVSLGDCFLPLDLKKIFGDRKLSQDFQKNICVGAVGVGTCGAHAPPARWNHLV